MSNDLTSPARSVMPASSAFAITPNDSTLFTKHTRAVYVGGSGDLKVVMRGGQTVTFSQVPGGTVLPIEVDKVLSTGTTATNILGMY